MVLGADKNILRMVPDPWGIFYNLIIIAEFVYLFIVWGWKRSPNEFFGLVKS